MILNRHITIPLPMTWNGFRRITGGVQYVTRQPAAYGWGRPLKYGHMFLHDCRIREGTEEAHRFLRCEQLHQGPDFRTSDAVYCGTFPVRRWGTERLDFRMNANHVPGHKIHGKGAIHWRVELSNFMAVSSFHELYQIPFAFQILPFDIFRWNTIPNHTNRGNHTFNAAMVFSQSMEPEPIAVTD